MKTKRFIALSSLLAASLALPFGGAAKGSEFLAAQSVGGTITSELSVNVKGIQSNEGTIMIGLYNGEDDFEAEQALIGRAVPVSGESARITFEALPIGNYALKVFHDEDSDGVLDRNGFGLPSEAYGFSNNASDPFSAPEWSEAQFSLPRGRMIQTIDLD